MHLGNHRLCPPFLTGEAAALAEWTTIFLATYNCTALMQTQTTGRNTETPCLETDSFTHSPMRTRRNVTARVTAPIVSDIWCSSTELLKHGTAQPSNCSPARARTIATQTLSRTHTHMHAHTHTLARMRTHSRPHSCSNAHLSQAVCLLAHLRSEQARLDLNLRCFFSWRWLGPAVWQGSLTLFICKTSATRRVCAPWH